MAEDAWTLLLTFARVVDERWDTVPREPSSLSVTDVKSAYHAASRTTHPDMGGTAEKFASVDRAKHILLEHLKRGAPAPAPVHGPVRRCHMCGGKGFVLNHKGFRALRSSCGACRGTGDLDTEHDYGDGR
jgi:DnaJ-class molecular chaperone